MTNEDELVKQYEGLIYLAIKRLHIFWRTDEERQEYIDSGYDGLIAGIRKYDSTKGVKQSTYVYKCIEMELKKRIYLNQMQKRNQKIVSLNTSIEDIELIDLIPDDTDIEKIITDKETSENLVRLINHLPNEKDRLVVKMMFGLDGWEQMKNPKGDTCCN